MTYCNFIINMASIPPHVSLITRKEYGGFFKESENASENDKWLTLM
jgi:hypothetical protein